MKYPIIFSLLFASSLLTVQAQTSNQQQPQPTPDYPMQKNSESEGQETQSQAANNKQQNLTPEQKAQKQTDHLQKKLGLTEEQKTKVYDLNFSRITKMKAAREKNKNSSDKQAAKMEYQKIKTDFDAGLKDILTDDQEKTWAQLKADAKTKRDAHHQQKGKQPKQQPANEDPDNLDID
jgi:protein CpxP